MESLISKKSLGTAGAAVIGVMVGQSFAPTGSSKLVLGLFAFGGALVAIWGVNKVL